jgi:hypothetical protein
MSSTHIVVMTSKSVVIASKFYAEVASISRGAIGESRPIKKFQKPKPVCRSRPYVNPQFAP